jgi:hypothetical protein
MMKTVGDTLEAFEVTGVKPGFNEHEERGLSAFGSRCARFMQASYGKLA